MFCQKCDSPFVDQLPTTGLLHRLSAMFSIHAFQCPSCKHRFRTFVNASEHRTADRIPVQIPVTFEWGGGHGEGILTDVSKGGCGLESNQKLTPGLVLRLHLPVRTDGTAGPQTQQVVTVQWVQGNRAGMKFLALTPQEQHQLMQTLTRCVRIARREERYEPARVDLFLRNALSLCVHGGFSQSQ